ncbi:MAG: hypothetical protein OQK52_02920 [Ignavibacteriaceae bacterium]|jgi:hypothetical protein|nr:hypothetical protein [Ignavibacteriaceae bacterium]
MKRLSKIFALLFVFILAAGNIQAQESEQPLLVVSFQKVKMSDVGAMNKMINEKFAPILNGLVDDKMLLNWGLFNHAWGDGWNVNVWYTVKDMASFDKFWEEYIKRINEKQPDVWKELRGYIQEHKDNIYTIMNQYPVLPQK